MGSSRTTVRQRLLLAFGGLAFLVVIASGLAVRALVGANDRFIGFVEGINARAQLADGLRMDVDRRAIAARNLVLVTKTQDLEAERNEVAKAHDDVQAHLKELTGLAQAPDVTDKARSLIAEIERVEKAYGPVALGIVKLAAEGQHDSAIARMNDECRPLLAALINATNAYRSYSATREKDLIAEAEDNYVLQRNLLVAASAIALAAAVCCGLSISRGLTRALGAEPDELGAVARRVAQSDLSPVAGARTAHGGSVLASLSAMQSSLASIVGQVRGASDSIATGSSQIATGNTDLSQRTEEQASALQQTAATMDQLSTTVRNNAENARHANQLAGGARDVASRGGEAVAEVVDTMRRIDESSKRIADILGTIDGIAFQTNILALNAAVEAARAGEQGRGFAVVASEVRSLAQRSAEAAREIKGLISTSVEQVEQGTLLVDRAGKTMEEIVAAITRVSDIVAEISQASVEQSSGVSQVGTAITQMDQVTQQNAALVEESAAAAESLKLQARELVGAVSIFRLAPGTTG